MPHNWAAAIKAWTNFILSTHELLKIYQNIVGFHNSYQVMSLINLYIWFQRYTTTDSHNWMIKNWKEVRLERDWIYVLVTTMMIAPIFIYWNISIKTLKLRVCTIICNYPPSSFIVLASQNIKEYFRFHRREAGTQLWSQPGYRYTGTSITAGKDS